MNVSLRTVGIAGAVAIAACAGAYVYGRSRVPASETTQSVASAETEKVNETVVEKRGPVTVHRKKTTPTPQGTEVTETTVTQAPVEITTSSEAHRTEAVQSESKTVVRPEKWWRVYGEADWKVGLKLDPAPSKVAVGADVKVLGPLRLGVKVEVEPKQIKDTAAVSAVVRAEF